jgi:Ca2+:H+ antiporter
MDFGKDDHEMSLLRQRRADDEITQTATHESLPQHQNDTETANNEKKHPRVLGIFRVQSTGESGRQGFHPLHFFNICFRSTCTLSMIVNVLWPFVPAAIAMGFARKDLHTWVFALNYIAMVPTANLLGFAGGELARKLPRVYGVLLETSLTSAVEIILFMVLIKTDGGEELINVIQAAILGSILANLLLCLGLCFFFGGMRRDEQILHEAVSEVGSGLLLVAGFGLLIPSAFHATLTNAVTDGTMTSEELRDTTNRVSRATAIILLCAYLMYVFHFPFPRLLQYNLSC